jgi:transcription termination factor Rho
VGWRQYRKSNGDLKSKTPAELVSFAEENGVENASTMRKQELLFAI